MDTWALLKMTFNLASALIMRLFTASCSLFFLMYSHNFLVISVRGNGNLPTISANAGLGFNAFIKAALGVRFFAGAAFLAGAAFFAAGALTAAAFFAGALAATFFAGALAAAFFAGAAAFFAGAAFLAAGAFAATAFFAGAAAFLGAAFFAAGFLAVAIGFLPEENVVCGYGVPTGADTTRRLRKWEAFHRRNAIIFSFARQGGYIERIAKSVQSSEINNPIHLERPPYASCRT